MPTTIFISHAGADWDRVDGIANLLREQGLQLRLDRDELKQGDSFLSFMESALSTCDYCLLLWSAAAAKSKWVRVEWEAAFHRMIESSQRFLLIGGLDNHPVPELLRPRLRVDLFPDPVPGIAQLIQMWENDLAVSKESARPIMNPACTTSNDHQGQTIYISSKSWDKTFPLSVNLQLPVVLIIEQVISLLSLPRQLDHAGKMGVRFTYELVSRESILDSQLSLEAQEIRENNFLWLQTNMQLFGSTEPVAGTFGNVSMRGSLEDDLKIAAQHQLQVCFTQLRLGQGSVR